MTLFFRLTVALAATLLAIATPIHAASSGVQRGIHLDIELLSEHDGLVAGQSHWLALRIQHDRHWHTYWSNPGDSGLPTRIVWTLPDGFRAGDVVWPYPKRLPVGPVVNFGYEDETWLLTQLHAPEMLPAEGTELVLSARVSYLVCEVECIPGENTLALRLPVRAGARPVAAHVEGFTQARTRLPQINPGIHGSVRETDDRRLQVTLRGQLPASFELFPMTDGVFDNQPFESWTDQGDERSTRHGRSDWYERVPHPMPMLLVDTSAQPPRAHPVDLDSDIAAETSAATATAPVAASSEETATSGSRLNSLPLALLLALAGGLVLNLMPCVFPVLSMKAMTLAQTGGDAGRTRREGWFYTLGVLVSFAVIGGLLLALRASGEQIGWGFQLQSPWLVAALAYLMFALGLSLSGAITIGSGWMNMGQHLTEGGGDRASFFTGVLACVVAAPCTAPFMGAALGYALTQPVLVAMSVFLALGLGLAAPLLALTHIPALARRMPRPGAWMETFKQALAFPMYLVAVWLLWVLALQTGANGIAVALIGLVALAFGLWLWERAKWQRGGRMTGIAATAIVLLALALLPVPQQLAAPLRDASIASDDNPRWQAWTPQRLTELRAEGRPVLVNMTAAWCITCLANERVALSSDAFYQRLNERGIAYLKGDWTRYDDAITTYLEQFDRAGVPIYVLYPRGNGAPQVLPQLLTPGLVLDALDRASGS